MFFWIIVLSFLIPIGMRYYRKSVRGRNRDQGMPGGFPGQFGQFPGDTPGGDAGNYPGQQNKQPRDGFTQRDYYGGFGQLGAPQPPTPPAGYQPPVPYEDSPGYPGNQPKPFQQQDAQQFGQQPAEVQQPSGPAVPPPPSAPQGFRARKLAELDQRYSNGELAMEDYMAQRAEIMKG
ncbi:hypothetical protein [Arthrobacter sp. CG_A4]|uniref:hypothetical protein n=1 Tax=Arthrobacter sp. CG_A4 TaxID=3071706 RepID=UPI002E140534